MTDLQKSIIVLEVINEWIEFNEVFIHCDFKNRAQFYKDAFKHELKERFDMTLDDVEESEKHMINYVFEDNFRSMVSIVDCED